MKLNRDQIVSPEASSEGSPTDSNSADDEVYVDLPEDDQDLPGAVQQHASAKSGSWDPPQPQHSEAPILSSSSTTCTLSPDSLEHLKKILPAIADMSSNDLLLSAVSFNCRHESWQDRKLGSTKNREMQNLLFTYAMSRWVQLYNPQPTGMVRMQVTQWRLFPSQAQRGHWLGQLLVCLKQQVDLFGRGFWNNVDIIIGYREGLFICTVESQTEVNLAGFCVTLPTTSEAGRGCTEILLIESFLPQGLGVGTALVNSVRRKGYTTVAKPLPEAIGFFLKAFGLFRPEQLGDSSEIVVKD